MEPGCEEAFFFQGNGKRLLGFLHRPAAVLHRPAAEKASEKASGLGVVYCHPFAEEKNLSHGVMARAARQLAEAGIAVLRFDFSGCGDSEGELHEADGAAWLAEIAAAERVLREKTGAERVGLWGLRSGANLALIRAQERNDLPFLILWQPLPGLADFLRIFLRQSLSTALAKGQGPKTTVKDLVKKLEADEVVEVIGYPIGKRLYESFLALDPQSLPASVPCPTLMLTLGPSELAPLKVKNWAAALKEAGAPMEPAHDESEPFWDRLWRWDAPAPARMTADWAAARAAAAV